MCRAYLSPAYDEQFISDRNPSGQFFTGRGNVGAVSLNLPMIYQKSVRDGLDFYEVMDHYMKMSCDFLKKRYSAVAESKASQNPLCFMQGGMVGGFKKGDECVGWDIVKNFTAGLGFTALNELNVLHEGVMLHESDQHFVNTVMDHMEGFRSNYNSENGLKIAIYGTPAESLCGTQAKQFRDEFGVIPGVSDRKYFSNSFHMHVSADLTPFKKMDLESELFHKASGGHIQYCRHSNVMNMEAIKSTVLRAMSLGLYHGVNFDLTLCSDCGHRLQETPDMQALENVLCPECGSTNLMSQSRACGYLSFVKLNGDTRFNDAKLAEIRDRKSM